MRKLLLTKKPDVLRPTRGRWTTACFSRAVLPVLPCLLLGMGTGVAADLSGASAPGGSEYGREFVMPKRPPLPPEVVKQEAAAESSPQSTKAGAGQAGARILVNHIRLEGVVDRPENDLRAVDVQAQVDRLLSERLAANSKAVAPAETSGEQLSREELQQELLRLVQRMEKPVEGDEQVTPEALQKLIDKLQTEQDQAGLSIEELQGIAAEVARYYRQHGLILAQAYIPPQTIRDGVVAIRVVEGVLGQVLVEQPKRYRVSDLTQPFAGLIGQPVSKASVEEALLLLSDYPGLKTFAVFQPGSEVGATDLLVSVLEENPIEAALHADNYGSQYTGEYRARAEVIINNPFNWQDRILLHVSRTFSPTNALYGGGGYEFSAFGARNTFGASYLNNAYDMGGILEPFGLSGITEVADVYWRRKFTRSPRFNSYGTLKFSRKSVTLDVTEGRDTADELSVFSIDAGFDHRTKSGRGYQSGWLQFSQGVAGILGSMTGGSDPAQSTANRRGGSGEYASSDFSKVAGDYQYWFNFNQTHTLRLAARGQYSADLLTSIEQFAMGGPGSVRAFSNAEYLADYGYSMSMEWLLRAPGFAQWPAFAGSSWGDILQFVLFVDGAQGWLNDPLASDRESVSLYGAGVGVRIYTPAFSMRFEIATPFGEEVAANGRDPQYFFEFNYAL